jgi:DNA modification methylase
MQPHLDDGDVRIWLGDAVEALRLMPAGSAQTCVTSPPFWGLRDYGTGRWDGGRDDCDHVRVDMARLYGPRANSQREGRRMPDDITYRDVCGKCGARRVDQQIGLEETPDEWCARLVAVFREVRRVLRDDGTLWLEVGDSYLSKGFWPDAPSNQRDDPPGLSRNRAPGGRAGKIDSAPGIKQKDLVGAPWLLAFALRNDGWYLRSDTIWARPNPMPESVTDRPTKAHSYVFLLSKRPRYFFDADAIREAADRESSGNTRRVLGAEVGAIGGREAMGRSVPWTNDGTGRNARSVWNIATEPTPFAHFATFPQALVERCVKAGSREGDTVLDPFMGSGTTALVARRLGRKAIGCELNADYMKIAAERLQQLSLLGGAA